MHSPDTMSVLHLHTEIDAPVRLCFDLSRSIDLHQLGLQHTREKAIGGKTQGLIEEGEWVTWRARHFMFPWEMTVGIVTMRSPSYFFDRMICGPFVMMEHRHYFSERGTSTTMTDIFQYVLPFGWLGRIVDRWFVKRYMTRLLDQRNRTIKKFAESEEWKSIIANHVVQ
jgi:ligand-binding SRPBCC domain-containing protein